MSKVSIRERFTDWRDKTVVELSVHHLDSGVVVGGFWVEIPNRKPLWVPLTPGNMATIRDAVTPYNT